MTDAFLTPLRALKAQLGAFPDLLERSDCPYPPHIRSFLAEMLLNEAIETGPMDDDDLVGETSRLYREVQRASSTMTVTDPKDQAALFKTMADLLNKLMTLREKALNVREMSRFQKQVVEVLESIVTPAQRSEFIEKLGVLADVR